jgi:ABC-2 type transport system ATP-binding protein
VEALSRAFGPVTALDAISFDVEQGALFGVVGPDGAGKTTLLRILAGVLRPTSGDAVIHGTSVADDPEGVKHRIAYMSQRFGLYGDLTVAENIAFYADLYGVPRAARAPRLERLYAFSNLGPFRDRLAANLSGGMKQKLSLCAALIHEPEVLLLDEPTFGVDPISRRELWIIIHEMVAGGMTTVVSTAYLDEAERCDRVAMMNGGRIAALDAPAALQEGLRGRALAFECADPTSAADRLREVPGVRSAALFGQSVHLTLERAGMEQELAAALAASGVAVGSVRNLDPSMEDVFIDLASHDHAA